MTAMVIGAGLAIALWCASMWTAAVHMRTRRKSWNRISFALSLATGVTMSVSQALSHVNFVIPLAVSLLPLAVGGIFSYALYVADRDGKTVLDVLEEMGKR